VKESVEVETLQSISSLTQGSIECVNPIVQHQSRETLNGRVPPNTFHACDSTCGYDPIDS
jgi:hypothetical protein